MLGGQVQTQFHDLDRLLIFLSAFQVPDEKDEQYDFEFIFRCFQLECDNETHVGNASYLC